MEHVLEHLFGFGSAASSDDSSGDEVSEEASPDTSDTGACKDQELFLEVGTFIHHHFGLFMEKEVFELLKKILVMETALDDIYTKMLRVIQDIQILVTQKADLDIPESIQDDMMASSSIAAEQKEHRLKVGNLKLALYFKGQLIENLEKILQETPWELFEYEGFLDLEYDQEVQMAEYQEESSDPSQVWDQDQILVQFQAQSQAQALDQSQAQARSHSQVEDQGQNQQSHLLHPDWRLGTFWTREMRPLQPSLAMQTQDSESPVLQPTGAPQLQTPDPLEQDSDELSQHETPGTEHSKSPVSLQSETQGSPMSHPPHLMQVQVHRKKELMLYPNHQILPSQEVHQTQPHEQNQMQPQQLCQTQQIQPQQSYRTQTQDSSQTQHSEPHHTKTQETQESQSKRRRLSQACHPRNLFLQRRTHNTRKFLRLFLERLNSSKSELQYHIQEKMKELSITMKLTLEKFIVDLEIDFLPKIMSALDYGEQLRIKLRRMMRYMMLVEKVKDSLETEKFPYLVIDQESPSAWSSYLTSDDSEDSSEDEFSENLVESPPFESRPQGLYQQLFERLNLVAQYLMAEKLCESYATYIKILERSIILMNDYVTISRQCGVEGLDCENVIPSTLLSAAGIHGDVNMELARKLIRLFDVTRELENTRERQRQMQEKEVYTGEESPVEGSYFRLQGIYHQESPSNDQQQQSRSQSVGSHWFRLQDDQEQEEPLDESQPQEQEQEQEQEDQESLEFSLPTRNTSVSVHINIVEGLSEFLDPQVKMISSAIELSKKMLEVKLSKLPHDLKCRLSEELALIQAKFVLTLEHLYLLMMKEIRNQQTLRSFLENITQRE